MKMFLASIGIIFLLISYSLAQEVIDKTKQFAFLDSLHLSRNQIESGIMYLDKAPYTNRVRNSYGQLVLFRPLDQARVLIAHPTEGVKGVHLSVITLYCEDKNKQGK